MRFCSMTLLSSLMLFLICSCATVPKESDLEEALKARAEQYWKLRMQDKYEETYKMEAGAGLPSFEAYQARARLIKKFDIQSHSVKEIKVAGTEATVEVDIGFRMPKAPVVFHDAIHDAWVFSEGKWLHRFP